MKQKTKGTLYTCDACGDSSFVTDIDTPPVGVHMATLVVYGGGDTFDVYSCNLEIEHMQTALEKAYKNFQREDNH